MSAGQVVTVLIVAAVFAAGVAASFAERIAQKRGRTPDRLDDARVLSDLLEFAAQVGPMRERSRLPHTVEAHQRW